MGRKPWSVDCITDVPGLSKWDDLMTKLASGVPGAEGIGLGLVVRGTDSIGGGCELGGAGIGASVVGAGGDRSG
jgi:hypothetical protein